jgi:hypothetical protein
VFSNALADFNPEFELSGYANYSFASKWAQHGVNQLRSVSVAQGEQQLGYVLVPTPSVPPSSSSSSSSSSSFSYSLSLSHSPF